MMWRHVEQGGGGSSEANGRDANDEGSGSSVCGVSLFDLSPHSLIKAEVLSIKNETYSRSLNVIIAETSNRFFGTRRLAPQWPTPFRGIGPYSFHGIGK